MTGARCTLASLLDGWMGGHGAPSLTCNVPCKAACHCEKCTRCTTSQLQRLSKHREQSPTASVLSFMSADKGLLKKACQEIKGLQVEVGQLKFSVPSVVNYQWQI